MKEFTVSEFRSDCKKVWQAVEKDGIAAINHRDREKMFVVSESHMKAIVEAHVSRGK